MMFGKDGACPVSNEVVIAKSAAADEGSGLAHGTEQKIPRAKVRRFGMTIHLPAIVKASPCW